MAAHTSISQSFQAPSARPEQQQQENQHQPSLSLCKKIMLTAALFGTEATVTFEQVYMLLSLQYLAVPVSLMTISGVVSALPALLLIPAIGLLVDKGSNPKKRKTLALLFALCLTLTGFLLVISACSLKMASIASIGDIHDKQSLHPDVNSSTDLTPPSATDISHRRTGLFKNTSTIPVGNTLSQNMPAIRDNGNMSTYKSTNSFSADTSAITAISEHSLSEITFQFESYEPQESEDILKVDSSMSPSVPMTGVLGILGFICIDVGFDIGNPLVRAFILDHSPPVQHTNLLVTGTLMSSTAGTLMSLLGIFDLPTALSETFHVDGTAATFIFLLVILIFVVITCYLCTLLTGKVVKRNPQRQITADSEKQNAVMSPVEWRNRRNRRDNDVLLQVTDTVHSEHQNSLEQSLLKECRDCIEEQNQGERCNGKTPFLYGTDTTNQTRYLSVSPSVSSAIPVESDVMTVPDRNADAEKSGLETRTVSRSKSSDKSKISDTSKLQGIHDSPTQNICYEMDGKHRAIMPHQIDGFSLSNTKTHTGDSHKKERAYLSSDKTTMKKQCAFLNKRLVLLVIASCFSMSTLVCFSMFISNTLTLGVYNGDPLALPGTTENENYQQGLRASALGSLICYICYFITCALNVKIYALIGERVHFMICHAALVICSCAFVVTQRVEAYYVAMAVAGPFRTSVYNSLYVLATKYSEDSDQENTDNHGTTSKAGRVMSLIGMTLPVTYIVISSAMAPLIDVTGSVWLPIIWGIITNGLSMITFSFLFFV